jgi:excisionase family DNA binding protein
MDWVESHVGDHDRRATVRQQPAKLLLTPEEAAAMLSVGRTRVYELIANGELAAIRIGRSRRIPVLVLERFVRQLLEDASGTSGERNEHG